MKLTQMAARMLKTQTAWAASAAASPHTQRPPRLRRRLALLSGTAFMAGAASANPVPSSNVEEARQVMEKVFGPCTGPKWQPKPYKEGKGRYLWTDSFGIMNYISLYHTTGEQACLAQAETLMQVGWTSCNAMQAVHDTLGRSREGTARLGAATDEHPTRGGLRIGKPDPEGTRDSDGQYYHYLTKFALALTALALTKQDAQPLEWAVELIKAIHPAFVLGRGSASPRMVWKTTIDLSRPAVQSMGNLDAYDGHVTYRLVEQAHQQLHAAGAKPVLQDEIADMRQMVEARYQSYSSNDPLDLGEALWIAHWFPSETWAQVLTERSLKTLEQLWQMGYFRLPAEERLAFREFGTTLGAQCNEAAALAWQARVQQLHSFWRDKIFMRDHDITPVMYASSLHPGVWARRHPLWSSGTGSAG